MVLQSSKIQTSTSVKVDGSIARNLPVESYSVTMPGADSMSTWMPSSCSTAAFSEAQLALKWGLEEVSNNADGCVTRSSHRCLAEVYGTNISKTSTRERVSIFSSVLNIFASTHHNHSADVPDGSSMQKNTEPVIDVTDSTQIFIFTLLSPKCYHAPNCLAHGH